MVTGSCDKASGGAMNYLIFRLYFMTQSRRVAEILITFRNLSGFLYFYIKKKAL